MNSGISFRQSIAYGNSETLSKTRIRQEYQGRNRLTREEAHWLMGSISKIDKLNSIYGTTDAGISPRFGDVLTMTNHKTAVETEFRGCRM
jgi:hypothetical protein